MLKKEEYEVLENVFGNDLDVCKEVEEYIDSCYIDDIIAEVADRNIPIYNKDLCNHCWELNSYVEEAKEEGLLEGANDLFDILKMGAYQYLTQLLYTNRDAIILNIAINHLNGKLDGDLLDIIDPYDLFNAICDYDIVGYIKQGAENFAIEFIENN